MSKLDELIQEYCPDGVETKSLGAVCDIKTGKGITSKDTVIDGAYPVVSGGVGIMGYYDKFNREANTVTIARAGSAGFVNFITRKFWVNDKCFSVVPKDNYVGKINSRFLYFSLKSIENHIMSLKSTGSVPTVNTDKLSKIRIATPPLEVQKEIVNILDKFTQLEAELSAELDARRKQYDYYRNQLLTFGSDSEVQWSTLGEIAIKISSGGTPKTSVSSYYGGEIPWLRTQEVDFKEIWDTGVKISESGLKNSSAKLIPKDCVIIAMYGATVGKSAINKIPLSTNQACANIQVNPEIADYKYVFHWVNHNYKNIKALGTGSQTNINAQTVRNFKIPVPPISEQKRIVSILDKFDDLVNDISAGLPAEINARRKQYEYYRTKLLTFQELPA